MRNLQSAVPFSWMGVQSVEFGTENSNATCAVCFADGVSDVPATYEAVDKLDQRIPLCAMHGELVSVQR